MRKLILLLLLLPAIGYSQHFEIGLSGGLDFHSLPIENNIAHQDKPALGYAVGARGCLLFPNAQLGVGVEMAQLYETNFLAPNYTLKIKNQVANPLIVPYGYYNLVWKSAPGYLYAGAMAGPAIAKVGVNTLQYGTNTSVTGYSTEYNTTRGWVCGLQTGLVMKIVKNVAANFEAAMRFTSFTYTVPGTTGDNPYKYRLFYFPITAGLRYSIK